MKKELTNIIYDIPLWALDIQMPRHLRRHLDAFWGMSFFHVCSTSKFMSPNFCSAMFCWRFLVHRLYTLLVSPASSSCERPGARLVYRIQLLASLKIPGCAGSVRHKKDHRCMESMCIKRKTFSTKTCFRRDMYRPLA